MKLNTVAIIGGGPIGLATALRLARKGYKVDVYEKRSWPLDKVCGQGIMPSGIALLEELGVTFNQAEESFCFRGIEYIEGKQKIKGSFYRPARGIERVVLSHKLCEKVCLDSNITLYPNMELKGLHQDGPRVVLTFAHGREVAYPKVFACDGLNSNIRAILGNTKLRKTPLRMGARIHFEMKPWSDCVQTWWSPKGEAYVTPVGENKVEIAFLWFEDRIEKGANLFERLMAEFPELAAKVAGAKKQNDFKAYGPFQKISRKEKMGNVFFVGDAFRFLDGITGEGISLGLHASRYVVENFETWDVWNHFRLLYYYVHYAFFVSFALGLSRHSWWRKTVFTFARFVPGFFTMMINLNDFSFVKKEDMVTSKKLEEACSKVA